MNAKNLIGLILTLSIFVVPGCGGGGGGGEDPNAPAILSLTASKSVALANGSDAITIQADVKKADAASAVADGTIVTFSVPDSAGALSASTAATSNGLASVTLTHPPVSGANFQATTVAGAAGSASGTATVKFINQPASADVFIAFKQPVTNLAALKFNLVNTDGATFDSGAQQLVAINAASGSLVAGNFIFGAKTTEIGLVNGGANGFITGTDPIIKVSYAIGSVSSLPTFSVDTDPVKFTAAEFSGGPTSPAVTASNIAVTVTFDTEK
jgi:hypothetical protein